MAHTQSHWYDDLDQRQINTHTYTDTFGHDFVTRQTNVNILQLNIRSISKNFDEFIVLLSNQIIHFHVIILTEAWITLQDNKHYNLPGYDTQYSYGTINKCDGVVIFTDTTLSASFTQIHLPGSNSTQINFTKYNKTYDVLAIYRPPSENTQQFIQNLEAYVEDIQVTNRQYILAGDLNIDILNNEPDVSTDDYINLLTGKGLVSAINTYTRVTTNTRTCIDHIFVNNPDLVTSAVLQTNITDHYVTAVSIQTRGNDKEEEQKTYTTVTDHTRLTNLLTEEKWTKVMNEDDVNIATQVFINTIQQYVTDCTTNIQVTGRRQKLKPWITDQLVILIRDRDRLSRRVKRQPDNIQLREDYRQTRNQVTNMIKDTKHRYYREKINQNNKNTSKIWKTINEITGTTKKMNMITEIQDTNGQIVTKDEPKLIPDVFNKYFTDVGRQLADKFQNNNQNTTFDNYNNRTNIYWRPADETEIEHYIRQLGVKSSSGLDGISTYLLKRYSTNLVQPLTYLTNLAFTTGIFPDILKKTVVVPIHKTGDKKQTSNYRPISLTSNVAKIIEKAMKTRLINFMETYILTDNQYGFRQNRSTQDAIVLLTDRIYKSLDSHNKTLTIFLDLQKAFDTVSHTKLLNKLYNSGVRGVAHDLLTSYLTGRKQCVRIHDKLSDETTVTYGVPQGTVLGPVLFLMYVNELCRINIDGSLVCFADDTVLQFTGTTWEETYEKATSGMRTIKQWLDENWLTLNISKTKYMTYSLNNKGQPQQQTLQIHKMNCDQTDCNCDYVDKVTQFKYLGVIIDQHLRWDRHVTQTRNRLRATTYKLRQLRQILDKKTMRQVYMALVQSIAQYGILAWGGAYNIHLDQINKILNIILRVTINKPYRYPSRLLYNELQVQHLTQLYSRQLLLYVYKQRHNRDFHIQHRHETRHRLNNNLLLPKIHTTTYKHSPSYLSLKLYNYLPLYIKNTTIHKIYKKEISIWILQTQHEILYTYIHN